MARHTASPRDLRATRAGRTRTTVAVVLGIVLARDLSGCPSEAPGEPASTLAATISDSGFEGGSPNSTWDVGSSVFKTPLCTSGLCPLGTGSRGGSWWVWFGGFAAGTENAFVSQAVTIPPGDDGRLSFYLRIGRQSGNGVDAFRVKVDATTVFEALESASTYVGAYARVAVDLSAFADGNAHTIRFEAVTAGPAPTDFNLDDVALNSPTAVASGDATVCDGQSATIQAALTGTPPWSVTWSDGITQSPVMTSPATRSVSPSSTTVYTVTSVSDAGGPGTPSGSATVTVNPIPAAPAITAPDVVASGATGLVASVEAHAGSTYAWTITNGTITGGQGTATIMFAAGAAGQLTLQVVETAGGCASAAGTKGISVTAVSSKLYTLTPCRVLDTREAAGTFGGPALGRLEERSWPIAAGACGVPGTARGLALNVTVVAPQAGGYVTLWPSDTGRPLTSTINFTPGIVRANNAVVRVASDGQASLSAFNGSDGEAHVLVDVTGYFE